MTDILFCFIFFMSLFSAINKTCEICKQNLWVHLAKSKQTPRLAVFTTWIGQEIWIVLEAVCVLAAKVLVFRNSLSFLFFPGIPLFMHSLTFHVVVCFEYWLVRQEMHYICYCWLQLLFYSQGLEPKVYHLWVVPIVLFCFSMGIQCLLVCEWHKTILF